MAMAKVWNDGPTDYQELFREEMKYIPRGKYIEMDQFDAYAFLSQYIPIKKNDVQGNINHKMLRMELVPDAVAAPVEHRCQACQGLFATDKELILHSEAFHKEKVVAQAARAQKPEAQISTK